MDNFSVILDIFGVILDNQTESKMQKQRTEDLAVGDPSSMDTSSTDDEQSKEEKSGEALKIEIVNKKKDKTIN